MKTLTTVIFLLISTQLLSQSGPTVVCVDCENLTERPKPRSGTYYNPDQSGTGFNIEIQNNAMLDMVRLSV
ncbi:MAG: hypothetical protein L3J52_04870 [Proteobacteria bacterium]|nr:hypothetical protein [Pseudomonadota bacterium]